MRRADRPVCVVTGASGGVGRATAVTMARRGYDVALIARGTDGLRGAAEDVLAHGGQPLAIRADVADWEAIRAGAAEIEERLGPIEVWVGNAMATAFAPSWEVTGAEYLRATEVTYLGQVYGTLAALEHMRPRDRGTIVSVSSALATRSIPLQAAYCGAKAGTRGFMLSLRTELLHERSRIRVTQVLLPAIDTPQFGWSRSRMDRPPQPVPPIYHPEVAARAIAAAAEHAPRQRVLGAWNNLLLHLDKFVPGVLDHVAARSSWESQQGSAKVEPRDGNLEVPLDDEPGSDRGAAGTFGDRAGGVLDPSFLTSIPEMVKTLAGGAADRMKEVFGSRRP